MLSFNAPRNLLRLPIRRCHHRAYASQFGALKASLATGAAIPVAHRCEHCPHTWHTGPSKAAA